jgi:excisionase family DNA binding protein
MKERLFSTADLGRLLGVSEATVKRWADTGRIGCFRTPGGHRKFRVCDLAVFVEATGYEVTGALAALLHDGRTDRTVEQAVLADDLGRLAERYESLATRGDVDAIESLLSCLRTRGVCLATAIDLVVGPAFSSIGSRWSAGDLSIVEEHVATNATVEALGRLTDAAGTEEAPLALTACLEGEDHVLGARAVATVLESLGLRAVLVGANTPVSALEQHLRRHPIGVLAISSKQPPDAEEFARQIRHLARATQRAGTRLLLGGDGFSLLPDAMQSKLEVLGSCRALAGAVSNGS